MNEVIQNKNEREKERERKKYKKMQKIWEKAGFVKCDGISQSASVIYYEFVCFFVLLIRTS
jgi:hypothetical protein